VRPGIANASEVLQTIDPAAVDEIVANVRALSVTLSEARGDIDSVLSTAGNAARQVERVTSAVSARVDAISGAIDNAARFAGSLGSVAPRIGGLVDRASGALDAVRNTVNAIDAAAINEILANAREVSGVIGARADAIGTAIDDAVAAARGLASGLGTMGGEDGPLREVIERAQRIAQNLEGASERVGVVVDRAGGILDGPAQRLVANVSGAGAAVQEVAAAFASRADQIAGGLARLSQGGVDDFRALLDQGRSTLARIEATVSNFDRNPSRVIFGGPDGPRYQPQRR